MHAHLPKRILFASPWWHQEIVNGTLRHAAEHGWHLDLQTCLSGKFPDRWDGQGVITLLGGDIEEQRRFLARIRCPAVSMNANHPDIAIARVSQDDAVAGRLAADHFHARDFRMHAYYSHGTSQHAGTMRRTAFAQAIESYGGQMAPLLWEEARGKAPDTWSRRQVWLRKRLKALAKPLAVFAVNDQAAVEVIEACMAEGIPVPDAVAVLGMLDMHIFRESTTISLSSITVDFDAITREACKLLARLMDGAPPPEKPLLFAPTGIAVRRSTNTIAAENPGVAKAVRYMQDHFAEAIHINDIAQAAGMSKSRLFEVCRQDLNKTPYAVLKQIRLAQARRLLTQTQLPVQTVAQDCGFGNTVNLFRNFQQHAGLSPAAYRKRATNPADAT